jgi:hypothetical protein
VRTYRELGRVRAASDGDVVVGHAQLVDRDGVDEVELKGLAVL